jgi:hypothetical protein
MYPTSGYTYPEPKVCIRCGGPNDCALYSLCDTCRSGDELAEYFKEDAIHDAHLYQEELDHEWELLRDERKMLEDADEDRREDKAHAELISYCREGY